MGHRKEREYIPVNDEKLKFLNQIGEGAYSKIYKVNKDEETQAVKIINITSKGLTSLLEVSIMREKFCENVNSCKAIDIDKKGYIHIYQDLAISDISNFIKRSGLAEIKTIKKWCWELITGLAHLHSRGIIHGDIKGKNILIYHDGSLRISDFSLATLVLNQDTGIPCGTGYTASHRPMEIWKREKWNYYSDIWALGCSLYEIAYGQLLFVEQRSISSDPHTVMTAHIKAQEEWETWNLTPCKLPSPCKSISEPITIKVDKGKISSSLPEKSFIHTQFHSCSLHQKWKNEEMKEFNDFILCMLSINPELRWTIWELIDHSFLDDVRDMSKLPERLNFPKCDVDFDEKDKKTIVEFFINKVPNNSRFNKNILYNFYHKMLYHVIPKDNIEDIKIKYIREEIKICKELDYKFLEYINLIFS